MGTEEMPSYERVADWFQARLTGIAADRDIRTFAQNQAALVRAIAHAELKQVKREQNTHGT